MIYCIRDFCNDTGFDFEETRDYLNMYCKAEFLDSICMDSVPYPIFKTRWYQQFLKTVQWEQLANYE